MDFPSKWLIFNKRLQTCLDQLCRINQSCCKETFTFSLDSYLYNKFLVQDLDLLLTTTGKKH